MYSTALERLATGGDAQATTLLAMSSVEWAESKYSEVLRLLTVNAPLFERIANHTIKGTYYNQLGITFRALAPASRKRLEYYRRAIQLYHAADEQFRIAKHVVFRAHVKNNIGNVMRDLQHFREAHKYQQQARRLFNRARDKVRVAQVDDSLAQLFIAEGKYEQAEEVASRAARIFERAGRKCFLAETLVHQGIALARMREESSRAQFIFQKAIEIAYNAGSLSRAGLATLSMIEEIDTLPREIQWLAFNKAKEWLGSSDSPDINPRLNAARRKLGLRLRREQQTTTFVPDELFNKRRDLRAEVWQLEHDLISHTLTIVNGKVTDAAEMLNMNHQSLAALIENRHRDLLNVRTPVVRRPRRKKSDSIKMKEGL